MSADSIREFVKQLPSGLPAARKKKKQEKKKKRARKREIKELERSVTPLKLIKSFVKHFNKRRREHRTVDYERIYVPVVVGLTLNHEGAESRGKLTKAAVKKSLAELEEPLSEIGWRAKEVEYYYRGKGHKVLVTLEAVEWSYSVEDYSDPYSSTST